MIDRASRFGELRVKEALHIHLTPDQRFNRDVGLELPGCWVSTLKTLCVKSRPPLIGKGFFPFFSMNELHGFLGVFSS